MVFILADSLFCFYSAVVVLAGALLKECLGLLGKGVHPTTISEALHKASEKAVEVIWITLLLSRAILLFPCLTQLWHSLSIKIA